MRGKVARTQINNEAKITVNAINKANDINELKEDVMKILEVNNLIIKIDVYSAMKINAKPPLLYSVLNPDTSSDSPSAKSNGVRLVSASNVVNQTIRRGGSIKLGQTDWDRFINEKSYDFKINITGRSVKIILTSYEIVWATLRNAPNKEYLELDAQPAPRIV